MFNLFTEYLLGETIMVAPILHPDKFKRDIYFPLGNWKEGETGQIYPGKRWVKNYNVPLDVLPYFIRQIEPPSSVNGFMPEEIV